MSFSTLSASDSIEGDRCGVTPTTISFMLTSTRTAPCGRTSAGFKIPNLVRGLNQKSFSVGLTMATMNVRSHTAALVVRRGPHPAVSGSIRAVCPFRPPTACTYTLDLAGMRIACLLAARANLKVSVVATSCKHAANSGTCDKTFMPSNPGNCCPESRTTRIARSSTDTPAMHTSYYRKLGNVNAAP
ncbi:hypothetical protein LSAT2_000772, partial [Lamellibrachia satsuma]